MDQIRRSFAVDQIDDTLRQINFCLFDIAYSFLHRVINRRRLSIPDTSQRRVRQRDGNRSEYRDGQDVLLGVRRHIILVSLRVGLRPAGRLQRPDTADINVAASISGTGTAQILNIDSTAVTISGPLTTTIAQTRIGATAAGSVAVGSDWNLENGSLSVGANYAGSLTIGAGGDVTNVFGLNLGSVSGAQGTLIIDNGGQLSDNANDSTKWDLIGYAAGSSGAVTVDGERFELDEHGPDQCWLSRPGQSDRQQRRQHRRAEF